MSGALAGLPMFDNLSIREQAWHVRTAPCRQPTVAACASPVPVGVALVIRGRCFHACTSSCTCLFPRTDGDHHCGMKTLHTLLTSAIFVLSSTACFAQAAADGAAAQIHVNQLGYLPGSEKTGRGRAATRCRNSFESLHGRRCAGPQRIARNPAAGRGVVAGRSAGTGGRFFRPAYCRYLSVKGRWIAGIGYVCNQRACVSAVGRCSVESVLLQPCQHCAAGAVRRAATRVRPGIRIRRYASIRPPRRRRARPIA